MKNKIGDGRIKSTKPDIAYLKLYQSSLADRFEVLQNNPTPSFLNLFDQLYGESNTAPGNDAPNDEVQKLIRALSANNEIRPQQTLILSSMGKIDGCSRFVLHLSHALKSYNQRCIIVDSHLKSRGFTRYTRKHADGLGLTDLLTGETPVWRSLTRLEDSEVFLLERGRNRIDADKLLTLENIRELKALFRNLFNYVIVEVPSFLIENNLQLWAERGDAIALIVNDTSYQSVDLPAIQKNIEESGIEFWGTFKSCATLNALRMV